MQQNAKRIVGQNRARLIGSMRADNTVAAANELRLIMEESRRGFTAVTDVDEQDEQDTHDFEAALQEELLLLAQEYAQEQHEQHCADEIAYYESLA